MRLLCVINMAVWKSQKSVLAKDNACPSCGKPLLTIEGSFVRWLTCPDCRYTKLIKKSDQERKAVKITPLKEVE